MPRRGGLVGCALALVLLPQAAADPTERTVLTGKIVDPSGALFTKARVVGTVDFYDPDNKAVAERFPASGYSVAADGTFVVREGTLRAGAKTLRFHTSASAEGYSTSDEVVSVPLGRPATRPRSSSCGPESITSSASSMTSRRHRSRVRS